jgi:adenylate cyclase
MQQKISSQAIQDELQAVLNDPLFQGAGRASNFLKFIVEETLAGRDHRLKEYTIGVEVFQKGEDFLPQADPAVRIEAGRLRKRLEQYYLSQREGFVEITIPKGGYVPHFKSRTSLGSSTGSKPLGEKKAPSLAIQPFDSATPKESSLFADLLTQELKKSVGNSGDFLLVGEKEGKSDYLLTGKIFRRRGSLLLYCDLICQENGSILWTESFPLKNPGGFPIKMAEALADQVAALITGRGGVLYDLIGEEMQNTDEVPVDPLGIRILYILHKKKMEPGMAGRIRIAIERLLAQQEDRGDLCALLSQVYWDFCMDIDWNALVNRDESFHFCREKALKWRDEAVRLDPDGEDTLVCGLRSSFHTGDFEVLQMAAEKLFRSGKASPFSMATGALLYGISGGWETGKAILDDCMPLITNHPGWFHHLHCQYHLRLMDYEEVMEKARLFGQGDILWYYLYTAAAMGLLGRKEEGAVFLKEFFRQCPGARKGLKNFLTSYVAVPELQDLIISGLEVSGLGEPLQPSEKK